MGNHDRHDNFDWHYNLPNLTPNGAGASLNGVDAYGNYWYRYNDALFVVLNTSASPSSAEAAAPFIAQFDATLEAATTANPDAKWLFVQHHKSTAAPASHQTDSDVRVWTPLFNKLMDKYNVDFVIAGHDHVYSRSWQILDNQKVEGIDYSADSVTNPDGTLYYSLNTSSGLKYYDFPENGSGNPVWVDDTSNLRYEGKNSITFNGKPWYTNVAVQVKAPQFTVVDVTSDSVTFTTYRTDDLNDILDRYTVIKSEISQPERYTVQFVDFDGAVLKEETVEKGESATAPADPVREGYTFTGWDEDFSCITDDLMVTAQYEKDETVTLVSATPSASVIKQNGNKNTLTITIVEVYSDASRVTIVESFTIDNNAADTYSVRDYRVYVDTKGNNQIRECVIVR
jgi:hypothetical protein